MKYTRKAIAQTIESVLMDVNVRQATTYLSEEHVVTATRRHKPDRRSNHTELCLTLSKPNFRQREFIRACKKAGEPFPVKKTQLKFYPRSR
jgi:hypothetical protein